MTIKKQLQESFEKSKVFVEGSSSSAHNYKIDKDIIIELSEAIVDDVAVAFADWLTSLVTMDKSQWLIDKTTEELFTYFKENVYGKN